MKPQNLRRSGVADDIDGVSVTNIYHLSVKKDCVSYNYYNSIADYLLAVAYNINKEFEQFFCVVVCARGKQYVVMSESVVLVVRSVTKLSTLPPFTFAIVTMCDNDSRTFGKSDFVRTFNSLQNP